jgi:hypothetical protein
MPSCRSKGLRFGESHLRNNAKHLEHASVPPLSDYRTHAAVAPQPPLQNAPNVQSDFWTAGRSVLRIGSLPRISRPTEPPSSVALRIGRRQRL